MEFGENQESLWLATSNSSIKNWSLSPNENLQQVPVKPSANRANGTATTNHVHPCSRLDDNTLASTLTSNPMMELSTKSEVSSMSSSFLMQNPVNSLPLITIKGMQIFLCTP